MNQYLKQVYRMQKHASLYLTLVTRNINIETVLLLGVVAMTNVVTTDFK